MAEPYGWHVIAEDVQILRALFERKREIAQNPIMEERRRLWTSHALPTGALSDGAPHSYGAIQRPMILAETGGLLDELVPLPSLQCQAEWARGLERELRELIYRCEHVRDDWVVEPRITYKWFVTIGDFGVKTELVRGDNDGRLGSYRWEPPVQDLDRDLDKLHFRPLVVDRDKTAAWGNLLGELFGDILPVENRGSFWWTAGLTWTAINLIGLQPLMMAMYDNPKGLHRLMAFLRDDFMNLLDWFEGEGLLSLNNEDDYVGSGGIGYASDLPQPDWQADRQAERPVRARDMWGLSESQETVGVSPQMFEEYVFQYQEPVARRFGLCYYGCCEPLHTRIEIIKRLPNLRSVSVSPWCDQERMIDALGPEVIYCRKPKPTLISTEQFDEEMIRADLRHTVQLFASAGCSLELAMKDVHTLCGQPWRLGRWVELARQECAEVGSG